MIRKMLMLAALLAPFGAQAAPGVGTKVYGATVEEGITEFEARYGRLNGRTADGEDGLVLEVAHGFSRKFYGAALAEFEREPGQKRKLEAIAFEGIAPLGRIDALGLDTALYGEYEIGVHGPDKVEMKALLQHKKGPLDARLNLAAEKKLANGERVEFGYAASADWEFAHELQLGFAAFGDLGSTRKLLPRAQHYLGPILKTEIEGLPRKSELEIEAGYLFALGAARDEARGQFRLLLEWEIRF